MVQRRHITLCVCGKRGLGIKLLSVIKKRKKKNGFNINKLLIPFPHYGSLFYTNSINARDRKIGERQGRRNVEAGRRDSHRTEAKGRHTGNQKASDAQQSFRSECAETPSPPRPLKSKKEKGRAPSLIFPSRSFCSVPSTFTCSCKFANPCTRKFTISQRGKGMRAHVSVRVKY